jgi:hypothetical protein
MSVSLFVSQVLSIRSAVPQANTARTFVCVCGARAIVLCASQTSQIDYWIVRNSWNTTFGEDGYFRVQRDTQQMGIFGGYFACFDKDCKVDPGPPGGAGL